MHYFVCVNRREAGDPLGPGCGTSGQALWQALRAAVAGRGWLAQVWVTRTQCLGLCPKRGAALACYPRGDLWAEVEVGDVERLLPVVRGQSAAGGRDGGTA